MVKGGVIKCEFVIPYLNASMTRISSADTTYVILLGNGTVDGSKWTHIKTLSTLYCRRIP